jgi:hypothetical protein
MLASFSTLENAFKDIMMPSRPDFSIIYISTIRWWKYTIFSFVHTIYAPPLHAEIKNEEICKSRVSAVTKLYHNRTVTLSNSMPLFHCSCNSINFNFSPIKGPAVIVNSL